MRHCHRARLSITLDTIRRHSLYRCGCLLRVLVENGDGVSLAPFINHGAAILIELASHLQHEHQQLKFRCIHLVLGLLQ